MHLVPENLCRNGISPRAQWLCLCSVRLVRADLVRSVESTRTYAGLLAVEDGVADGRVGIAVAPLHARRGRGRARGARRRDPGPRRREPPQRPDLPVKRHQEPEVLHQYLPRRRRPAAPSGGEERGRPGGGVLAAGDAAPPAGGRRALGRAVQQRRGRRRPRRAGQVGDAVSVLFLGPLAADGLAGEEAAVADDLAGADQHRGRRVTAPAAAGQAELEVALRRGGLRGPPHGEELGGVHVDEGPGAAEGIAEVGANEALERRRRRAALEPPAGEAVAEVLQRGDLHERRAARYQSTGGGDVVSSGRALRRGHRAGTASRQAQIDIGASPSLWAGRNVHVAPLAPFGMIFILSRFSLSLS